jgi:hypothetical protein
LFGMTNPAALAEPDPLAAHAAEAGAMLRELAAIGMGMARDLGRFAGALAASAPEGEAPTPDQVRSAEGLMRAFGTVSRAVRQSLALQGKLIADVTKARETAAAETARRTEAQDAVLAARRARGKLRRAMAGVMAKTAIEALEREPLETERLLDDLEETLYETRGATGEEVIDDADFADVEVDALALQLCDGLNVDPGDDWWINIWRMENPARIRLRPPVPAQPPP